MPAEASKEIELEIAYVLFIDIVGYSKLVTSEQRRLLELLNQIVRQSEHFRTAEAKSRLITVPTGDGMALVFYNTPEAPVECALAISKAASEHPELKLRMSAELAAFDDVRARSIAGHKNVCFQSGTGGVGGKRATSVTRARNREFRGTMWWKAACNVPRTRFG